MENDYLKAIEPEETLWQIEVNGAEFISIEEFDNRAEF